MIHFESTEQKKLQDMKGDARKQIIQFRCPGKPKYIQFVCGKCQAHHAPAKGDHRVSLSRKRKLQNVESNFISELHSEGI